MLPWTIYISFLGVLALMLLPAGQPHWRGVGALRL